MIEGGAIVRDDAIIEMYAFRSNSVCMALSVSPSAAASEASTCGQVETHFDDHFGHLLVWMHSDNLKSVWDNTIIIIIIFTADNGADFHISCNYPLRGGKNTYFDGSTSQRVATLGMFDTLSSSVFSFFFLSILF